jgi:hypothetical protein
METAPFVEETRNVSARSRFSDAQILSVAQGGKDAIADWVSWEASQQGIALRRRPVDVFAKAVSRLSDGVVELDPVEETLVALSRAGVISAYQRGLLHVRYLR